MTAVKMDYSSKEAKKVLKDYYYWRVLYRDSKAREQLKRYFGYDDPTPCHDNLDHTLDIKRGIDKGILIAAVDRNHDDVISELLLQDDGDLLCDIEVIRGSESLDSGEFLQGFLLF